MAVRVIGGLEVFLGVTSAYFTVLSYSTPPRKWICWFVLGVLLLTKQCMQVIIFEGFKLRRVQELNEFIIT